MNPTVMTIASIAPRAKYPGPLSGGDINWMLNHVK